MVAVKRMSPIIHRIFDFCRLFYKKFFAANITLHPKRKPFASAGASRLSLSNTMLNH